MELGDTKNRNGRDILRGVKDQQTSFFFGEVWTRATTER